MVEFDKTGHDPRTPIHSGALESHSPLQTPVSAPVSVKLLKTKDVLWRLAEGKRERKGAPEIQSSTELTKRLHVPFFQLILIMQAKLS